MLTHDELGLTLHPFDLATNKVLALVGRLEVRDWIDVMTCHDRIQPLGYLAWAACGKDPAFGPAGILEEASRSTRYTQQEFDELEFAGDRPDAAPLALKWRDMLHEAHDIVLVLPPDRSGTCVLERDGTLCSASAANLRTLLERKAITFHGAASGEHIHRSQSDRV